MTRYGCLAFLIDDNAAGDSLKGGRRFPATSQQIPAFRATTDPPQTGLPKTVPFALLFCPLPDDNRLPYRAFAIGNAAFAVIISERILILSLTYGAY